MPTKPSVENSEASAVSQLLQRLANEGLLIIYLLSALILMIALATYSPADPSWSTGGSGEEINNHLKCARTHAHKVTERLHRRSVKMY